MGDRTILGAGHLTGDQLRGLYLQWQGQPAPQNLPVVENNTAVMAQRSNQSPKP